MFHVLLSSVVLIFSAPAVSADAPVMDIATNYAALLADENSRPGRPLAQLADENSRPGRPLAQMADENSRPGRPLAQMADENGRPDRALVHAHDGLDLSFA